MRNNLRVINGGLSNEEYAARKQRKEDLAVWGDYREWDESIAEHILYDADEAEIERFLEYLAEDDEDAPQLYTVNNDDDIAYLEYEVEMQELLRKQEQEMTELFERQERELEAIRTKQEESMGLIRRFIKKVFGAK